MNKTTIGQNLNSGTLPSGRGGFVLLTSLALLFLLSMIVVSLMEVTLSDKTGATFATREKLAFYQAEAGVRYVMSKINADILAGTLRLTNPVHQVSYPPPAGYTFEEVRTLYMLPNTSWYAFTVTGRTENAVAIIEATVRRPRLLSDLGIFGDLLLNAQPNVHIYSYNSDILLNPTPADSTGQANIGSNQSIIFRPGVILDGLITLGAALNGFVPSPPAGYDFVSVGRVDPDPLGAIGGPLAAAFAYYSVAANNNNAAAGIVGNRINLGPGSTLTLPPGKYYLTDIYMPANSTLNVPSSPTNPTVIYLDGQCRIQPNANINISAGQPSNFYIFSNEDDEVKIQPNGDFRAFVYAPYAPLDLQPNGAIHGIFWGKTVYLLPGNDIFVDVSMLDDFLATQVILEQWRRIIR